MVRELTGLRGLRGLSGCRRGVYSVGFNFSESSQEGSSRFLNPKPQNPKPWVGDAIGAVHSQSRPRCEHSSLQCEREKTLNGPKPCAALLPFGNFGIQAGKR